MIDFHDIPEWWAVCMNDSCPMAVGCLRRQACKAAPENVTRWRCVLPNALHGGECRFYIKAEKKRMARGFRSLFAEMKSRDARHDLRILLSELFGSKGSYYRSKNGERLISPERQRQMVDLIGQYGYNTDKVFDAFVEMYDFEDND